MGHLRPPPAQHGWGSHASASGWHPASLARPSLWSGAAPRPCAFPVLGLLLPFQHWLAPCLGRQERVPQGFGLASASSSSPSSSFPSSSKVSPFGFCILLFQLQPAPFMQDHACPFCTLCVCPLSLHATQPRRPLAAFLVPHPSLVPATWLWQPADRGGWGGELGAGTPCAWM